MARHNIELKARVPSLEDARAIAEQLGATRHALQHQRDTYFHCQNGRLKLREIDGETARLIWYSRPDLIEPKSSEYYLVPVDQPALLKQALAQSLGVRAVVEKSRLIYLYDNVRIHLDDVHKLGTFLEFEAVLDRQHDSVQGHKLVRHLQEQFGIQTSDLLTCSYGELVLGEE